MTEPIGFKGTEGNWSVGRLLDTYATLKWSEEDRARVSKQEALMVFSGFTPFDQGRGRIKLTVCESPEDAKLMAASKQMAIALQKCERIFQGLADTGHYPEILSTKNGGEGWHFISEALKQAGL